ncbi:hypothetical protein KSP39_PZI022385 [Platanthera zijinensis]|uniref:Transposase n=1 Tax=Platanthera zijinensis TaxID=2320716 RepID=A0AAP0AW95_9ASPA
MMKEIHSRKFEHRVAIMLNEYSQPLGPDKAIVNQFSSFLGTLARIPSLCRIDCTDWRLLKTKEKMWSYAQKKWIIPDEGKKWVLATINGSWRRYKTIIKQKFYKPYDNDKERLLNRPKGIPEEQFKRFIEMVGSKQYKKLAIRIKRSRKKQINMHTTVQTSFACVRNELVCDFVIPEFKASYLLLKIYSIVIYNKRLMQTKNLPRQCRCLPRLAKELLPERTRNPWNIPKEKIVIMLVILLKSLVFVLLITKMYKL